MLIRIATLEDLYELKLLDHHIHIDELRKVIILGRVYILELDKKIIGCLRYGLFWDNTPFINLLYILEEYRNRGYGSKFMWYFETEIRVKQYTKILLSTQSDETAKDFYSKIGYRIIGGFTLTNEVEELIMCKDL